MPPKPKIARDMIVEAGFQLLREQGIDALNARSVAARLQCSTQPVMHHFATMDDLKKEVYQKADAFHSDYLMNIDFSSGDPMLSIGLRYIRFAAEEAHLFRFLFQSNQFANTGFLELTTDEALGPMLDLLQSEAELTPQQSQDAFSTLFLTAHGLASLLANNTMPYDEAYCTNILTTVFIGTITAMKGSSQ